jgi:hypothetical protein
MQFTSRLAAIVVLLLTSSVAVAHPGHGSSPGTAFGHYLTEPLHLLLGVLILAAGALVFSAYLAAASRRNVAAGSHHHAHSPRR